MFLYIQISRISVKLIFITIYQVINSFRIMHIRSCSLDMVDKHGVLIDADMCFIAKVPLITFLDRMRFGVTLSVSIFCRGGRCNEGRIDYSALFEYEVMFV